MVNSIVSVATLLEKVFAATATVCNITYNSESAIMSTGDYITYNHKARLCLRKYHLATNYNVREVNQVSAYLDSSISGRS